MFQKKLARLMHKRKKFLERKLEVLKSFVVPNSDEICKVEKIFYNLNDATLRQKMQKRKILTAYLQKDRPPTS
jgi:hypothetical protein